MTKGSAEPRPTRCHRQVDDRDKRTRKTHDGPVSGWFPPETDLPLLAPGRVGHLGRVKKLVLLAAVAALAGGCAPTYVNLTPRKVPRMPENVYPFEVQWDSPRTGANNPDVKAYVRVGTEFFPMSRIPNTTDRWEARVPLPPGRTLVQYSYKFDYTYPGTPFPQAASDRSPEYSIIVPRQ